MNRHDEEALRCWQAAELTALLGRLRLLEEERPTPERDAEIRELRRRIELLELQS